MKLWIDDVRKMPNGYDFWAKSFDEAIHLIDTRYITHISFDHDLGEDKTGYDIASAIERRAYHNVLPPITWDIHSANPVGAQRIRMAMKSAERFWISNKYIGKY